ncbi:hypothetical protein [Streptomyces phytophilus]|nr:hypothetical protein [Streptomyces phytophilus]
MAKTNTSCTGAYLAHDHPGTARADPGDEDDNTDIEDGDGGGGNPSPGHR